MSTDHATEARVIIVYGKIFLKTLVFLAFVALCAVGIAAICNWGLGRVSGQVGSNNDIHSINPVIRWVFVVAVILTSFMTFGYMCLIRFRWIDSFIWAVKPISIPEQFMHDVREAVDGVSIASGIPDPEVLVFKDDSLNALTLKRRGKPCLFFTRGLLVSLDREELTGVAAHEFAHIKNGDLDRSAIPESFYFRLIKMKVDRREWLSLLGAFIPVILWVAVLSCAAATTIFKPEANGDLLFSLLMFLLASIFLLYFLAPRPRYGADRKARRMTKMDGVIGDDPFKGMKEVEFAADRNALMWTYYPEGLTRALRKCQGHSASPELFFLDNVTFVSTLPAKEDNYQRQSTSSNQATIEERIRNIIALENMPGIQA